MSSSRLARAGWVLGELSIKWIHGKERLGKTGQHNICAIIGGKTSRIFFLKYPFNFIESSYYSTTPEKVLMFTVRLGRKKASMLGERGQDTFRCQFTRTCSAISPVDGPRFTARRSGWNPQSTSVPSMRENQVTTFTSLGACGSACRSADPEIPSR